LSTRPARGPRARRPSRSTRSNPFNHMGCPVRVGGQLPGGSGPAGRSAPAAASFGRRRLRAGHGCAAGLDAPAVPPRRMRGSRRHPARRHLDGLTPARAPRCGMLKLGELGARERNPPLIRAEVHEYGLVFHAEDDAEPVLVMCHLIACREPLGWGRRSRCVERAARQVAPGRGAGCLHSYHHAPPRPRLAWPTSRRPRLAAPTMTSERVVSMAHCLQWGAASRARRSYIAQ